MKRNIRKEPEVKVEVGMGATMGIGSDAYAYEIIEVINPKHVIVRSLDSKMVAGGPFSECQEYEFTSNPNNHTKHVVFRYGRWRGNSAFPRRELDSKYERWTMDYTYEYRDPSF